MTYETISSTLWLPIYYICEKETATIGNSYKRVNNKITD